MSLAARLSALATASLFEAAGKRGAMDAGIKPLVGSEKIAGRAVTAETPAGDNLVLHQILAGTFSGEILVVDGKSECRIALWGEVMTAAAQAVGLAALVVDGVVRDAVAISSTGFPIYARGLAIPGPAKDGGGQAGIRVHCGGVSVSQGDWIIADADGVVVLPAERAARIADKAEQREEAERAMIVRLATGETSTLQELGLSAPAV